MSRKDAPRASNRPGVRAQLARQYVIETRDGFDTIAHRLAFADASAFFRAFRRWTNTTPAQFRKRDAVGPRAKASGQ